MELKLKLENGRQTYVNVKNLSQSEVESQVNEVESTFGSPVISVNQTEVEKHGMGGFIVGAVAGGYLTNLLMDKGAAGAAKTIGKGAKKAAVATTKVVKNVVKKMNASKKKSVGKPKVDKPTSSAKKPVTKTSTEDKEAVAFAKRNVTYLNNGLIRSVDLKSGKRVFNKDIIDGAHLKDPINVPANSRYKKTLKELSASRKLTDNADYVKNNEIDSVNTSFGKTIPASKLVDGTYIRKGVKFKEGGSTEHSVARTILSQLGGGNRIAAMTGANTFIDGGNYLSFKIKNAKANYIKIKLNSKDLYDVEISRIRGFELKPVKTFNDVYAEDLIKRLEEGTGMAFRLENGGTTNEEFGDGGSTGDNRHTYMMLGRLQMDNDYFLGNGNRSERQLWGLTVDDHISEMKKLWNSLPADGKPEWLTMEQIEDYERQMKEDRTEEFGAGGSTEEDSWVQTKAKALAFLDLNYPNSKEENLSTLDDDQFNRSFTEMVEAVRVEFPETAEDQSANNIVDQYIFGQQFELGGKIMQYAEHTPRHTTYFTYDFKNKGNIWNVLIAWGANNYVSVMKKTNNPYGGRIAKHHDTIEQAMDQYKDMNIKSQILFAAREAEKHGYVAVYKNGGRTNDHRHVNHSEDYEVRYAMDKPHRKGYKGNRRFEGGGATTAGYTLNKKIAFTTSDDDSYLDGTVGGNTIDLIDVKNVGKNQYEAIAKSHSIEFEGIDNNSDLEDAIYNQLNEEFSRNSDIDVSLESVSVLDSQEYALGGGVELNSNKKYLNSISPEKRARILKNIANHYGISVEEAEEEVTDVESEALYEYITDNALRMEVYNGIEKNRFEEGGSTESKKQAILKVIYERAQELEEAAIEALTMVSKSPIDYDAVQEAALKKAFQEWTDNKPVFNKPEFSEGGSTTKPLNSVKVIFENPEYNYTTSVASGIDEEAARKYFVGKQFNVGSFPQEIFERVIDIEYTDGSVPDKNVDASNKKPSIVPNRYIAKSTDGYVFADPEKPNSIIATEFPGIGIFDTVLGMFVNLSTDGIMKPYTPAGGYDLAESIADQMNDGSILQAHIYTVPHLLHKYQDRITLRPLEVEPLSTQLNKLSGFGWTSGNWKNEDGSTASAKAGNLIENPKTGHRWIIPPHLYNYVDGENLYISTYGGDKAIRTYPQNYGVAKVTEDGILDFTHQDKAISLDKTKVKEAFEKGLIPASSDDLIDFLKKRGVSELPDYLKNPQP